MKDELVKKAVKATPKSVILQAKEVIVKNSPLILTGVSIAGVLSTTVLAVKATPKAVRILENAQYDLDRELTKKEVIQATYKCYIPAAIMGGVTVACIVGAHSINHKRNVALASVYSLTEKTLKEYQSKVVETIGEKKEKKIKDDIAKDRLEANPKSQNQVIITGKGTMSCYDPYSGRYFDSDYDLINRAVNTIGRKLLTEMTQSLNDVYYEMGLKGTKNGDILGWHIDEGMLEPSFSSHIADDGRPCLVIDYNIDPTYINFD